jgi:hypothetical protein
MTRVPVTTANVAKVFVPFALLVLLVASCGGDGKHSNADSHSSATATKARSAVTTQSSTPVVTSSPASTDAAAKRAVARAYVNYWNTFAYVDKRYPESQWRHVLSTVAVDPFLSEILQQKRQSVRQGLVTYGHARVHVTVAPIGGSSVASVTDCEDASHTGLETHSGRRITVGPRQRMEVTATAVRGSDGRWRMKTVDATKHTCSS